MANSDYPLALPKHKGQGRAIDDFYNFFPEGQLNLLVFYEELSMTQLRWFILFYILIRGRPYAENFFSAVNQLKYFEVKVVDAKNCLHKLQIQSGPIANHTPLLSWFDNDTDF